MASEPVEVSLDEAGARVRAFGKGGIPDTRGHLHRPFLPADGIKASLLFFVLHDCPKANALAPEMARLAALAAERGMASYVVYAEPDLDVAVAATHAQEYAIKVPALLDTGVRLAEAVGARTTPEAALVVEKGALVAAVSGVEKVVLEVVDKLGQDETGGFVGKLGWMVVSVVNPMVLVAG